MTTEPGGRDVVRALSIALGALLAACSAGGGGGQVVDDIAVGLTTAGGATTVAPSGTLVIKANVTNTVSNMDVTWSLSGPSCPGSCGTITATATDFATYAAPPSVAAQFTVTVTATSVENPRKSGSVTLTVQAKVCPAAAALLGGQYAFLLQGFDQASMDGIAVAGSFVADGCGVITRGEADYYFGPTAAGNTSLTGQYSVGDDRRGTLTLTVGPVSKAFAIALGKVAGGVATKGAMTEMDSPSTVGTVLSGSMWLQNPAAFALNGITGSYAFVLNGWNGSGPREAMGGTVYANGAGNLGSGLLDSKAFNGAPVIGVAWTGTYGAPSSGSGRSVLTAPALTGTNGTAVMYVVGAGRIIAMVSDTTSPGRVFSGSLLAQAGPFSKASLSGDGAAYQTANYDQPCCSDFTMSVLSLFSADGLGSLSLTSFDANAGGNPRSGSAAYTYTVSSSGHATISTATGPPIDGGRWYLTGTNTGLMLGFDAGVSVGAILPRPSGPFSAASISGSYFASQAPGAAYDSTNGSGIATSTGNGTLSYVMDLDTNLSWGQGASATLTVPSSGRAVDSLGNVIYVVSPTSFLLMDVTTSYPVVLVFEQ